MDVPAGPALLLMLLDTRAPTGAHGHSGGMEAAVTAGFVTGLADAAEFCRWRLRTYGPVAAAFAAEAARLWLAGGAADGWAGLDAELSARIPSPAARQASRQLGSGLRRLVTAMAGEAGLAALGTGTRTSAGGAAPHHPLVLGAAVAIAGGGPPLAAVAAALGIAAAPASAAVRLLGLDPYAVQGMLAGLAPEINQAGTAYGDPGPGGLAGLPALSAPALDLLADVHARSEVRLFAS